MGQILEVYSYVEGQASEPHGRFYLRLDALHAPDISVYTLYPSIVLQVFLNLVVWHLVGHQVKIDSHLPVV